MIIGGRKILRALVVDYDEWPIGLSPRIPIYLNYPRNQLPDLAKLRAAWAHHLNRRDLREALTPICPKNPGLVFQGRWGDSDLRNTRRLK